MQQGKARWPQCPGSARACSSDRAQQTWGCALIALLGHRTASSCMQGSGGSAPRVFGGTPQLGSYLSLARMKVPEADNWHSWSA